MAGHHVLTARRIASVALVIAALHLRRHDFPRVGGANSPI
jgi:hypothetical protein